MKLDYGIADTDEERLIAKLAAKIDNSLKGQPAAMCMMALADVTARAMVEETASHVDCVDAFSAFMAIVAKEMTFRRRERERPANAKSLQEKTRLTKF